jgi:hypothetical protein
MFSVKENYFTKEECDKILVYSNNAEKEFSKFNNVEKISYYYIDIFENADSKWIFDKINDFVESTNNISVINSVGVAHLHYYNVGDKFEIHTDDNIPNQIFAVGVCLNDNYDGGEFVLHEPHQILPKTIGATYLFSTFRPHEIKTILNGERWSLIIFFKKEHIKINNII